MTTIGQRTEVKKITTKLGIKELIRETSARKAFNAMVSALDKSLPAKMSANARLLRSNTNGSVAIYVPQNHPYRSYEFNSNPMRSIYFPAVTGIPILFGAISDYRSTKFSMKTAHSAGTLNNLDPKIDRAFLCAEARKVKINRVIFFQTSELVPILIDCNQ